MEPDVWCALNISKESCDLSAILCCLFVQSLMLCSAWSTDLSGLSEEQDSVSLFEPQPEQRLHHYKLARALPVAKVLLLSQSLCRNAPQHVWPTSEQVWVVTDLPQGY